MNNDFKKDDMINYLKRINDELKAIGETGEILIAGGASMCLVHDARPSTKDIDALYEPKNKINEIADKIAKENHLQSGWINDGVKGFLHPNMKSEVIFDLSNLRVSTVSAEALLTMKLTAMRASTQDLDDAKVLMKKLNINDEDKLLEIMSNNTYKERLTPITQYKAIEVLKQVQNEGQKLLLKELLKQVDGIPSIYSSYSPDRKDLNRNVIEHKVLQRKNGSILEFKLEGDNNLKTLKMDNIPHMSQKQKEQWIEQAANNTESLYPEKGMEIE